MLRCRGRDRRLLHVLVGDGDGRVAGERWRADQQLVEDAPERVDVRARIDGLAAGLLGAEVGGGAHHRADLGEVLVGVGGDRPGDAEVGDLHQAGGGDEDVAGLHVAVDDAVAVGEAERGGDVGADVGHAVGVERALGAQDVGERAPVDVLHDDEVGAVGLAPVVDADDVGVVEVGGRGGLPPEPLDERLVGGELREQDLHGDRAVEQLVPGEEHLGHAAAPEAAVQLVATVEDGGAGFGHVVSD